ncbi:MAG: hypothetical protein MN733_09130 [Nitrososphaera sp.]|nr:hypothetical protein [Nitrososphaera sp.]
MFRPSNYKDLREALRGFADLEVDYVLVDSSNSWHRLFLKAIYDPQWSKHFVLIRSFDSTPEQGWIIRDMDGFQVVY